jgi:hypothetical protein
MASHCAQIEKPLSSSEVSLSEKSNQTSCPGKGNLPNPPSRSPASSTKTVWRNKRQSQPVNRFRGEDPEQLQDGTLSYARLHGRQDLYQHHSFKHTTQHEAHGERWLHDKLSSSMIRVASERQHRQLIPLIHKGALVASLLMLNDEPNETDSATKAT